MAHGEKCSFIIHEHDRGIIALVKRELNDHISQTLWAKYLTPIQRERGPMWADWSEEQVQEVLDWIAAVKVNPLLQFLESLECTCGCGELVVKGGE